MMMKFFTIVERLEEELFVVYKEKLSSKIIEALNNLYKKREKAEDELYLINFSEKDIGSQIRCERICKEDLEYVSDF